MKRILVVSFIFPFPPTSGGGRDIYERIKALRQHGCAVDLITTPREIPDSEAVKYMQTMVNKLWVIPRTRNLYALLSLKPFQYETRTGIKSVALSDDYDAVLLESEFVGGILENPTLRARRRILRVHNDEPDLYRSLAKDTTTFAERASFLAESYKLRHYSPQIMKQCDQLWYISDKEFEQAAGSEWSTRAHHVPVLVNQADFKRPSLASSKVLYVGALSIPINSHGLIWYMNNVHPHLLSIPGYEFVLAGKTGSAGVGKLLLDMVREGERVTYLPNVADLTPLYDSAGAFVNPIQRGAGVKIKSIDATIAGLPIVATSVGVEGTGFLNGIHAVVADSAENFTQGVRGMLDDKERAHAMVSAAQQLLAKKNGSETISCLLEQLA